MAGRSMITATHTRKARRDLGACPLCRIPMHTGEYVCRVGCRGSWVHIQCFLARYRSDDRSAA